MVDFKVGDLVEARTDDDYNGVSGVVIDLNIEGQTFVRRFPDEDPIPFGAHELILVESVDNTEGLEVIDALLSDLRADLGGADAVSPGHYQFPGGAEVKDISQHLSGLGAQIVQYVARATRIDGKVKGNPVEDLRKAEKMLAWEIERLEEAE